MKLFFIVFAAIILAALVLFEAHSMQSRFAAWQERKIKAIAAVERLSVDYKEDYAALGYVLLNKPFFDLNVDEREWLEKVEDVLRPVNEPGPTPLAQEPSFTNDIPRFVTVTMDLTVGDQDGNEVTIPTGSRLRVISKRGDIYFVEYKGGKYLIPFGVTQPAQ